MNKVLFVSGIGGDTRRYRCLHHQEQLALKGVGTALREDDDPQMLSDVFECDLVVLHRVPFSPLTELLIALARAQGKPVVFESDDLVFDPNMEVYIGFLDTLAPGKAHRFRADLARLNETFRHSDCVLTSTEFLAEEARKRGKLAFVHRNAPSAEMFRLSEQAWDERQQRLHQEDQEGQEDQEVPSRPVVLGYFSGTNSHNRDFATIAGPLTEIMATYPQVCLHIGGYLDLGPAFEAFQLRIRRTPYMNWRELPWIIAQTDINLAPLEMDNPFCQAKSEIKFVEAALVGVPTVASRVGAFEHAITQGRDGLLVASPDEWSEALRVLIDHSDRRRALGEAARRTVYARYTPEQRADELWATLDVIHQQFSDSPVSTNELSSVFLSGVIRYASEAQRHLRNREEQIDSLRQAVRRYEEQLVLAERQLSNLESRLNHLKAEIADRDRYIVQLEQHIVQLEQHIEAIMQGRVMRLMTGFQRRWRQITRKEIETNAF